MDCETRNAARASRDNRRGEMERTMVLLVEFLVVVKVVDAVVKPRGSGPRGWKREWVLTRHFSRGGKSSRTSTSD